MATYFELYDLLSSNTIGDLRKRIRMAVIVKAQAIAEVATPAAGAITWAKSALEDPQRYEDSILRYVLANNKANTVAQIEGATDAQVQTAVNTAVDKLYGV